MDREVIVAIEGDANIPVRMARAFEESASPEDITEFVRDWAKRFDVNIPDETVDEISYALSHRSVYRWSETYCLQICKAD